MSSSDGSKLEWQKVTLDPLSALLQSGEDNEEDIGLEGSHQQTETQASGGKVHHMDGSRHRRNNSVDSLGSEDQVLKGDHGSVEYGNDKDLSSSSSRFPQPPVPVRRRTSTSPQLSSTIASNVKSQQPYAPTSEAMRQVGDVLNNLGTLLSNSLDSFSLSLSSGGGGATMAYTNTTPSVSPSPLNTTSAAVSSSHCPASSPPPTIMSPPPLPPSLLNQIAKEDDQEPNSTCDPINDFLLLTGEGRLASLPNLQVQTVHGLMVPCQLVITSYRIIFLPTLARKALHPQIAHLPADYFKVPMALIERTERDISKKQSLRDPTSALLIYIKDGRMLKVVVPETPNPSGGKIAEIGCIDRIKSLIDAYAFPEDVNRHLFCFAHYKALHLAQSPLTQLPQIFSALDLQTEYNRQFTRADGSLWIGSPSCPWRYSRINESYNLCPSYPSLLVVPREVTEEELSICAAFRSEQRLPVLTWGSANSSASIWRSSQPRVGMSGSSCVEDEKVLRLMGAGELGLNRTGPGVAANNNVLPAGETAYPNTSGPSFSKGAGILRIMDLRNKTAAMANRATGHGYESSTNYPNSTLTFCNIGNIHAMRDSYLRLLQLVHSTSVLDVEWSALVEGTKWLTHVRLLINAAYRTAHLVLRDKASVLLHCSHGWDRTSQVSSLAQLMLDPYYRTYEGFPVLIEKDWLAFGHPFQLRLAHGQDRGVRNEEQVSPIFLQFLDAVWQLLRQHPNLFEFNARYLICLADHLHDCRFGQFLCNTSRERHLLRKEEPTISLWTYLEQKEIRRQLSNPFYGPGRYGHFHRLLETPVPSLLRRVSLWNDYFLRWSAKPCHPPEVYLHMRRRDAAAAAAAAAGTKDKDKNCCHPHPGADAEGGNSSRSRPPEADLLLPWVWIEEEEVHLYYREALTSEQDEMVVVPVDKACEGKEENDEEDDSKGREDSPLVLLEEGNDVEDDSRSASRKEEAPSSVSEEDLFRDFM